MKIMDIEDLMNSIKEFEEDFDIVTSPTMKQIYEEMKFFLKILSECSKMAEIYLQLYDNPKWVNESSERYKRLQKTGIWKVGRYILRVMNNDSLSSFYLGLFERNPFGDSCYFCGESMDLNKATLHHTKYKKNNLFNPKYIAFGHYKCHLKYHKQNKLRRGAGHD